MWGEQPSPSASALGELAFCRSRVSEPCALANTQAAHPDGPVAVELENHALFVCVRICCTVMSGWPACGYDRDPADYRPVAGR